MKVHDAVDAALACAVAEGVLGLLALLATLASVRLLADESTRTASIVSGADGTELRLAPGFFESEVEDGRDSLWVLAHELGHRLDLHLAIRSVDAEGRYPQRTNLLLDVLVNTKLDRVYLPGGCALQRRLYPHDAWPQCLLLGPRGLVRALRGAEGPGTPLGEGEVELLEAHFRTLDVPRPGPVARLLSDADSNPEPMGWLRRALRTLDIPEAMAKKVAFVGSHGRAGAAAVTERGRQARARGESKQSGEPGIEASAPGLIRVQRRSERRATARTLFLQAVRRAVMLDLGCPEPDRETSAMPRPGRRDAAMLGCDLLPVHWHPRNHDEPDGERVRIYLDVSGSFHRYLSLVLWLVEQLGDQAFRPLWAWSSSVWPIGADELRRGNLHGDPSATLIGPVLQHVPNHSRALIITDGCFHVEPWMQRTVQRRGLDLVFLLFGGGQKVQRRLSVISRSVLFVPDELL